MAEGLDMGQGLLDGLPLPMPPQDPAATQEETADTTSPEELGKNLDLEFPPLLATIATPTAGAIFGTCHG